MHPVWARLHIQICYHIAHLNVIITAKLFSIQIMEHNGHLFIGGTQTGDDIIQSTNLITVSRSWAPANTNRLKTSLTSQSPLQNSEEWNIWNLFFFFGWLWIGLWYILDKYTSCPVRVTIFYTIWELEWESQSHVSCRYFQIYRSMGCLIC